MPVRAGLAHAPNAFEETELRFEIGQALSWRLRETCSYQAAVDSLLVVDAVQPRLEFLVDVAHGASRSRVTVYTPSPAVQWRDRLATQTGERSWSPPC